MSDLARQGLARLPLDGKRVIVLIPDGTRTMPMPLMFEILERELGPRVAALDFLVALGTHTPMSDEQLSRHVGRRSSTAVPENGNLQPPLGRPGNVCDAWDDSGATIAELTLGRLNQDVPVALNRLVVEYDHVLICGPVFPHEVVGFSGGTKYLFPGIAASEIIHFTHWLGALITSSDVLGTIDTPIRTSSIARRPCSTRRSRCSRWSSPMKASRACSAATPRDSTTRGGKPPRFRPDATSCGWTNLSTGCSP